MFHQWLSHQNCIRGGRWLWPAILCWSLELHSSTSTECYRCSVVCLCVYLLITIVSATKTVEPIETPFGLWTLVGPKNRVLGEGPGPQGRGSFGGNFHPIVRCKEYMSVMTVRFLRSSWRQSSLITMRHRSNVKKRWLLSLDALRFMQLPFVALLIIVI